LSARFRSLPRYDESPAAPAKMVNASPETIWLARRVMTRNVWIAAIAIPASAATPTAAASEIAVSACRRCPRLVSWRELVARERRAAYANERYWGRPVPGFGDPAATVLLLGLAPAAHDANSNGRMFTGDR
jgi:hypothetical protein